MADNDFEENTGYRGRELCHTLATLFVKVYAAKGSRLYLLTLVPLSSMLADIFEKKRMSSRSCPAYRYRDNRLQSSSLRPTPHFR